MTSEEQFFEQHAGKTILLDSNLLLVLLTGSVGTHLFGRFKRVNEYSVDYEFLIELVRHFRVLETTPHILTEVSNLAGTLSDQYRDDWFENLAAWIKTDQGNTGFRENYIAAKELVNDREFIEFGITDSAIAKLGPEVLVLTDDYRLSGTLRKNGIAVFNFRELRAIWRSIQ